MVWCVGVGLDGSFHQTAPDLRVFSLFSNIFLTQKLFFSIFFRIFFLKFFFFGVFCVCVCVFFLQIILYFLIICGNFVCGRWMTSQFVRARHLRLVLSLEERIIHFSSLVHFLEKRLKMTFLDGGQMSNIYETGVEFSPASFLSIGIFWQTSRNVTFWGFLPQKCWVFDSCQTRGSLMNEWRECVVAGVSWSGGKKAVGSRSPLQSFWR